MPQLGLSFLPQQTVNTLEEIFAYIAQSNRKCYVAIDEFQQVDDYPEDNVEELLRGLVDRVHNVHFIFSGSKLHVMDLMFSSPRHPFYRSTEKMYLTTLDKQKYYDFAVRHLAVKNIELSENVFDMMYGMVDGVTWYVQAMLNRIYRMEECNVTAEDVMWVVKNIIAREEEGYKNMFRSLTNGQANLLKAIAREGIAKELTAGKLLRGHNLKSVSSIQRASEYLINEALGFLCDAGIIHLVQHTAANGLPLGAETNKKFRKYIFLDSGLMLRIMNMDLSGAEELTEDILTATASDLVNKGSLTEMVAGWELIKYAPAKQKTELFYWENTDNGATSEVDYIVLRNRKIVPLEVKSGTSGKMKSLRLFMQKKSLDYALRCSLENFAKLENPHIYIIPLYAISDTFF